MHTYTYTCAVEVYNLNSSLDTICSSPQLSYPEWPKQGDALSPLLFNFGLEYVIRKFQENQIGLKLNRTHKLLAYVDDVNLLGETYSYIL
jgi:hypothetical protein